MSEATDNRPFIVVKRRKRDRKSKTSSSVSSDDTVISNPATLCGLTVIIKPNESSKLLTKINPLRLKEHLESIAPDGVIQIRPNPRLNLLALDTRNSESTKALLTVTLLGGIPVIAYEPRSSDKAQGVIYGLSKDIQDAELTMSLKAVSPVFQVRRLGTSEAVKLIFNVPVAPEYVTVGFTRFRVFPYTENPWQCTRCYHFGHISSTCTKPDRCSRCGGNHVRASCSADLPRCINCKREHDSTSRRCPKFKTEQEICNYKSGNRVGYVPARTAILQGNQQGNVSQRARDAAAPSVRDEALFPPLPCTTPSATADQSTSKRLPSSRPSSGFQHKKKANDSNITNVSPLQGIGAAIHTIASLLRSLLQNMASPCAKSAVSIIDAILPFIMCFST